MSQSIDSDINNFKRIYGFFGWPRGFYLDQLIEATRAELHWECDYLREASVQQQYKSNLEGEGGYYVPRIVSHMTTKTILCSEFIDGVEIDTLFDKS